MGAAIAIAFLVVVLAVGAYDVYASFFLPPGSTVSYFIQGWSKQFPALAFAVGFLVGHLFWPLRR